MGPASLGSRLLLSHPHRHSSSTVQLLFVSSNDPFLSRVASCYLLVLSFPTCSFLSSVFPSPSLSSAGLPSLLGLLCFPCLIPSALVQASLSRILFFSSLIVSGLAYLYSSPVLIEQKLFFFFFLTPDSSIALFFSLRDIFFFFFSYSVCRFWLRERHFSSIPKLNRRSKKRLLFPRVCRSTPSPLQLLAPSIAKLQSSFRLLPIL